MALDTQMRNSRCFASRVGYEYDVDHREGVDLVMGRIGFYMQVGVGCKKSSLD